MKFAPHYSILLTAEQEEKILQKAEFKPYLWWRYIDDIFFIWQHGEENLKSFIDNINKMHRTVKSMGDWSKFSWCNGIYRRRCNRDWSMLNLLSVTNIFYHFLSYFYCKKSIPYNQALRLNKICSNNEFFDKRCNDLSQGCTFRES